MRRLELLAPAKNYDVAMAAINHGADAVYIGAEGFGARSAACNSIADITRVVEYAHKFNARVYVTFNTLIYDNELAQAETMIKQLYRAGVDALIIQDMGILRMDIPPIELHASTQCDIRTADKASFLESVGFSQLVLARELSQEEITHIRQKTHVRLEAFVQGALCVSYSGRCQVSQALKGRSANRGECAQICRLPFDLTDDRGNVLAKGKHLLSLRDLNLSDRMNELITAGIDSFKIEGRLKDANYVKNAVAYYRRTIDQIISQAPQSYCRASNGHTTSYFTPDLHKEFNRGFTHYFFDMRDLQNGQKIASTDTPKSLGENAGKVASCNGKKITVSSTLQFNNGDGISYFDNRGNYNGFRVNRVENNNTLILPQAIDLPKGTTLYRTYDKLLDDRLNSLRAERKIMVDFRIDVVCNGTLLILEGKDERGNHVTCSSPAQIAQAEKPQGDRQAATLSKTGNTIYECGIVETAEDMFIPQSILADLRRQALAMLDNAQKINYHYGYRLPEDKSAQYFCQELTYSDNVANHLAANFYKEHGVKHIAPAMEVTKATVEGDNIVMHTRYCLRRELGLCLKTKSGIKVSPKLFLRHGDTVLTLHFDCKNCEMKVMI